MSPSRTCYKEPIEVRKRIDELGLNDEKLILCGHIALAESRNVGKNFPANASGTFAYQHGIAALRTQFVDNGEGWAISRADGVESMVNEQKQIKVAFQNVDRACDSTQNPKPRSPKGKGSERACSGNLNLFPYPDVVMAEPPTVLRTRYATYYLMVDDNGRIELSRVWVENGTFKLYLERIFIDIEGDDGAEKMEANFLGNDTIDDFDIDIARRS